MRVGRLLRSTEGVGAESHRVTGWRRVAWQVRGVARGRGVAAHRAGKQAVRRRRGTNGAGTLHVAVMAFTWRRGRQAWRRQALRRQAWRRQRLSGPGFMWRTWVGVVSLMRVPDEGDGRRVPGTLRRLRSNLFSVPQTCKRHRGLWSVVSLFQVPRGAIARCLVKLASLYN